MAFRSLRCRFALVALAATIAAAARASAGDPSVEDLKRELQAMKRQMQQMQETMRKQEAAINALSARHPAASAERTPVETAVAAPAAVAPAVAGAGASAPAASTTLPWSPEQPIRVVGSGQAYVNLSFDALVDAGWSTRSDVPRLELGDHDLLQRGVTIPNAEIVLDGAVDPYFKGFANLVFKLDRNNETTVELEETYLTTTSLPWNLQVKAGQFLTEFGRQNQQHPHAWDFVDAPLVLGRILGTEGLRNPGARVSWLAPTPFYSEAFFTVMDSQGSTAASFRDTGNPQFGRAPVSTPVRNLGDLLFVPRYTAAFDLTPSQTLVAGVSGAFGPNATGSNSDTQIYGADLYWRWKPEWQSAGWPFVSVQTEGLYRRFEAGRGTQAGTGVADVAPIVLPRESLHDYGFYAQGLYGFTRRWVAGLRGEYVTADSGAFRPDPEAADRFRLSSNMTFYPTEFSKIRLQWNYDHGQAFGDDHSVWVQTEFLLGSHAAHKF